MNEYLTSGGDYHGGFPGGGGGPVSPRCEIGRVSNGYVVTVYNAPPAPTIDDMETDVNEQALGIMVDAGIEINRAAGAAAHRGLEEEADTWKKEEGEGKDDAAKEKAKAAILLSVEKMKAARHERVLRARKFRPVETFVFLTFREVVEFVTPRMDTDRLPLVP